MFGNPMELALIAGAAIILFGGNKIRDVARGLGAAKQEFAVGQAEADLAAERTRAEARAIAEANATRATTYVTEPQAANGMVVGSPSTPTEPPAPHD
jgi:Sec-independent protein translocase protein TatA